MCLPVGGGGEVNCTWLLGSRKGKKGKKEGTYLDGLVELGVLDFAEDSVAGNQVMAGCFTRGLALDGVDESRVPFGEVGEVEELLRECRSVSTIWISNIT